MLNEAREKLYAQGGILSVTSRILVVDLLSSMGYTPSLQQDADRVQELLDPERVTGLVVLHAEKYDACSLLYFRILRLG